MNRHHHTSTKGTRVSKPRFASASFLALSGLLILGVSSALAAAPTVTIEPASEVAYITATGNGEVDPEACLNEALRAKNGSLALPDCRAYELVTPPYGMSFQIFSKDSKSKGTTQ
jgi:hypothetical protein